MTSTVTSHTTHAAMQPLMHDHDPCDIIALRGTSSPRNSPANFFLVPCLLSTAWSAKTVLPIDSQVVVPPVWGSDFPASLGCGHPSNTLLSSSVLCSSLYGMFPYLVRCGRSHDSKVATLSNAVVRLARLGPIMNSFSWPTCMTLLSSLLISSWPTLHRVCKVSGSSLWTKMIPTSPYQV